MLASLKKLFFPAPFTEEACAVYVALVERSRKPWFYDAQAVPDTVDGRFDVIILHLFLVIQRLRADVSQDAAYFSRVLSEAFFSDMDRNIREMGSTDTGVAKRIKNMAQAFYGRLHAYESGMAHDDSMKECLKRNLYRESEAATPERLEAMAQYIKRQQNHLAGQSTAELLAGRIHFID